MPEPTHSEWRRLIHVLNTESDAGTLRKYLYDFCAEAGQEVHHSVAGILIGHLAARNRHDAQMNQLKEDHDTLRKAQ